MIITDSIKENELNRLFEQGDYETLLRKSRNYVADISSHEPFIGRALFVPFMDNLIRRTGAILLADMAPAAPVPNRMVHIASAARITGGGTRAIEDSARILPEYEHVLILTDAAEDYSRGKLSIEVCSERLKAVGIIPILLPPVSLVDRIKFLATMIGRLSPQRIFLHTQAFDVITYAAISGNSAPYVFFVHHEDNLPSLGATRRDYIHVDPTPACHDVCKAYAFTSTYYLPLTVKDRGTVSLSAPSQKKGLVGVTCANAHKFCNSYKRSFTYGTLLGSLFAHGVDKIYHLGNMPEEQGSLIKSEISATGQDAERVEFMSNVPELTLALKEISPDFYLTSYPVGGGKAMVEVMSMGLPILTTRPPETPPLSIVDFSFGNEVAISNLAEIPAALKKIRTQGASLGQRNRMIYEQHYSADIFRKKFLQLISFSKGIENTAISKKLHSQV